MSPVTFKLVSEIEGQIKSGRRFLFQSCMLGLFQLGLAMINGVWFWVNPNTLTGIATMGSVSLSFFVLWTTRKSRRRMQIWKFLQRDIMRMDASPTPESFLFYKDQAAAHFRELSR